MTYLFVKAVSSKDLTATSGHDYTPLVEEKLYFLPGESIKYLNVSIVDDSVLERDEQFELHLLSGDTRETVGERNEAFVTVFDDEGSVLMGVLLAQQAGKV